MSEAPFTTWVRERPRAIQEMMIAWPPEATVRAKDGEALMIPAPGIDGRVASWFEDGTIGVAAPLLEPLNSPVSGEHLVAGQVLRGQCDPNKLEVVGYAAMPDGTVLDSDYIRGIVHGPAELDLRGSGFVAEAAATAAGRTFLDELSARGGFAEAVQVIYDDPAGFRITTVVPGHPEPPLWDPETGFRSGKRRNEVWCETCGRYYHFRDPHPHEQRGRSVDWPLPANGPRTDPR